MWRTCSLALLASSKSKRRPSAKRGHTPTGKRRATWWALLLAVGLIASVAAYVGRSPEPAPSTFVAPEKTQAPVRGDGCPIDLSDLPAPPPSSEEIVFVPRGGKPGMPTVRGELGACSFAVLVDTGVAGSNIIMGWFARRLGLRTRPGKRTAVDIAGRTASTLEIDRTDVFIPTIHTTLPIAIVEPSEDRLMDLGIAAILSPRYTVSDGRILVLELGPRNRMRTLPAPEAEALFPGRPTFDLRECEGHFQVDARVEGRPATLEIDTGSMASVLYSESSAGRPLARTIERWEQVPHTALGGAQDRAIVSDVHIDVGPLRAVTPIEIMRGKGNSEPPCGFDGVLGSDFLFAHACALLVEVPRMRGYCSR